MLVFRSGCVPGGEPAKLRAQLRAPSPRNHPVVNRSHFNRERGMTIAKLAIVGLYSKWLNKCALQAMKHRPAGLALSRACRELSKSRHLPKELEQRAWSRLLVQVLSPTTSSDARGCTR